MALNRDDVDKKVQQFIKKGQWKNALDEMRKLLAVDKSDPMITLRMGDIFLKLNDKEKAAISYFRTASLFAVNGHKAKAIATYKMVLRVDPYYEGVQERLDLLAESAMPARAAASRPAGPVAAPAPAPVEAPPAPSAAPAATEAIELSAAPPMEIEQGRNYGDVELGGGSDAGYDASTDMGVVGSAGIELDNFDGGYEDFDMSSVMDDGAGYDPQLADTGEGLELDTYGGDGVYGGDGAGMEEHEPGQPIPLFSSIPHEEMVGLIQNMKSTNYDKDQVIVSEGDEGDSLYIVKSGGVRVVTKMKGREVLLATLGEREFFGEVSFLTGRPRTADIIADAPSEILELTRGELDGLIGRYPDVKASLRMFHESRVEDTLTSFKALAKDLFA